MCIHLLLLGLGAGSSSSAAISGALATVCFKKSIVVSDMTYAFLQANATDRCSVFSRSSDSLQLSCILARTYK